MTIATMLHSATGLIVFPLIAFIELSNLDDGVLSSRSELIISYAAVWFC